MNSPFKEKYDTPVSIVRSKKKKKHTPQLFIDHNYFQVILFPAKISEQVLFSSQYVSLITHTILDEGSGVHANKLKTGLYESTMDASDLHQMSFSICFESEAIRKFESCPSSNKISN